MTLKGVACCHMLSLQLFMLLGILCSLVTICFDAPGTRRAVISPFLCQESGHAGHGQKWQVGPHNARPCHAMLGCDINACHANPCQISEQMWLKLKLCEATNAIFNELHNHFMKMSWHCTCPGVHETLPFVANPIQSDLLSGSGTRTIVCLLSSATGSKDV